MAHSGGGTMFLDKTGVISTLSQRLVIEAVAKHVYSPLGSTEVLKSRFRRITCTYWDFGTLRTKLATDFLDRKACS